MSRFRFLNVGQGLFYSGKLADEINFVYDCGTATCKKNFYINNAIFNEYSPKEVIEYFFVSHLHNDHINGFDNLNQYCCIKNIILPYLGANSIFIYISLTILSNNNQKKTNLLMSHYNSLYSTLSNVQDIYFNDEYEYKANTIKVFNQKKVDWTFWCISKVISKIRQDMFISKIERFVCSGEKLTLEKIKDYINNGGFKSIKDEYIKEFGKKLNVTNMCLLHHPTNDFDNITLLTGDVEFDHFMINKIDNYVGEHSIRYLQIPHHGCYANWNKMCNLKNKGINYYISFGLGNSNRHPSSGLINELIKGKKTYNYSYQDSKPFFHQNEYHI